MIFCDEISSENEIRVMIIHDAIRVVASCRSLQRRRMMLQLSGCYRGVQTGHRVLFYTGVEIVGTILEH